MAYTVMPHIVLVALLDYSEQPTNNIGAGMDMGRLQQGLRRHTALASQWQVPPRMVREGQQGKKNKKKRARSNPPKRRVFFYGQDRPRRCAAGHYAVPPVRCTDGTRISYGPYNMAYIVMAYIVMAHIIWPI